MQSDFPESFRKYAVSTRVSTDDQKEGTSPSGQDDLCKLYGNGMGWEYVATFDDFISGGSKIEDRPALTQLLDLLKRRVITDVIFHSVDRAIRDLAVMKELFTQIYILGGRVSIATKRRTYKTYADAYDDCLFEGFMAMYERQKIRQRTESGKIYAFENGALISIPKTGYKIVPDTQIINGRTLSLRRADIDPVAAEYVNKILDTLLECGNKNAAMVKLNREGMKTVTGKPMRTHVFDDMSASVMLYAGEPVEESIKVEEGTRIITRMQRYPAIISLEKAYKVQKILDSVVRKNADPNKPFLGVGICKNCGKKAFVAKMKSARGGYLLMCSSYKNALTHNQRMSEKVYVSECNHHVGLQPVIDELHNFLLKNYNTDVMEMGSFEIKITAKAIKIITLEDEVTQLDSTVSNLEREIEILTKAYVANLINPAFMDINRELNTQVKEKRELVTSILDDRTALIKQIQDRKQGLATLGVMLSDSDYADIRVRCEKAWRVKATKDTQFELIKEIYEKYVLSNTQDTREKIQVLVQALSEGNWEQVNGLMRSIGLIFTADFSEPHRETRRQGVRVQLSAL